jgi:hypothetical protein
VDGWKKVEGEGDGDGDVVDSYVLVGIVESEGFFVAAAVAEEVLCCVVG